jgi:hypothetical protein
MWSLRKKLRDAYKLSRESPSQGHRDAYSHLKAEYQRTLRAGKKESWKSFCSNNLNGDSFGELKKLTLSTPVNNHPSELLIGEVSITDPKDILSAFSSHFFPTNPPDDSFHKSALLSSTTFCEAPLSSTEYFVLPSEVKQAFDSVRLSKSAGSDGISSIWLNHSFDLIKSHLAALFSVCFNLGYFPKCWKTASIVILKKDNKPNYLHPNCFRPISIINSLSKLFEKIILAKLKALADTHSWFSPSQHGFRAGLSTETASLSLIKLIEGNKKKMVTCCAFLDIKSAFDAAWHPAILNSLIKKGCPQFLVKILGDFLSSRSSILKNVSASFTANTKLGCPQGSVLSPFL